MNTLKINDLEILGDMEELSDLELQAISGGGWFKDATGISTPEILVDLDEAVRKNVPGGWVGVAIEVVKRTTGSPASTRMANHTI